VQVAQLLARRLLDPSSGNFSFALELRLALLEECLDALAVVLAAADLALQVARIARRAWPAEAYIAFLIRPRDLVGPPASCRASFSDSAINCASSTHFQIRPQRSASSADSRSPVMASAIARCMPARRGRK
jgi:hypothetical protein